jgi:hypothetical protein
MLLLLFKTPLSYYCPTSKKERIQYKTKEKDWRQEISMLNRYQPNFGDWAIPLRRFFMVENGSSRRSFFKLLAAAPLLSQIAVRDLYASAVKTVAGGKQNVYSRLGVKTIINCRGTWTYLSGSLEFPEVRQAQLEASEYFVNMLELQRAVGRRLAELTGAESGIVTSGSAGAMAAATAACMANLSGSFRTQPG